MFKAFDAGRHAYEDMARSGIYVRPSEADFEIILRYGRFYSSLDAYVLPRLPNMSKILLGFYVIVTKIDDVYEVPLPAEMRQLLVRFTIVISFGLAGTSDVLQCLGLNGFANRLLFWMLFPFCLIGSAVAGALALLLWRRRREQQEALAAGEQVDDRLVAAVLSKLPQMALPLVVRILFLLYPIVTNAAFEAFSCYDFKEDRFSSLVSDVAITCTRGGQITDEWGHVLRMAVVAILLYPVGMIVVNSALLYVARKAIRSRRSTLLSNSIRFLWEDFEPWFMWWECVLSCTPRQKLLWKPAQGLFIELRLRRIAEMTRRLVLVGIMLLVFRGTMTQLTIGCVFSVCYLCVSTRASHLHHTLSAVC
jgi:hypothetical protein